MAALALFTMSAAAQETYQSANLVTTDLNGTARYVGMGGAMEALGADISTMSTNPAGIGLFRRSVINMSAGLVTQTDADTHLSINGSYADFDGDKTKLSFDQLGFVYSHRVGRRSYLNFGFNYHKSLSPEESAQQIIRHVDDGVEIARKHKLPEVVIDFIRTHHARTVTFYFYAQYCNAGGDPENREPFMYHGELPTTKEQVIVLMADAVEAASRSLKDYTPESISALVDSIISKRLSDSQLVEADISIKEVEIVKRMFKERLEQVYHERIAYPTLKKS